MRSSRCTRANGDTLNHTRVFVALPCRARQARFAATATAALAPSSFGRVSWDEPILISGAGIAGLATALALSKVGLPVRVFESGPRLRQGGAALSLWSNAWRAMDALGVAGALRPDHLLLSRVELCSSRGDLLRGFDLSECDVGPEGLEVRGLKRDTLLQALYDSLPDREQVLSFGAAVQEVLPAAGGGSGGGGVGVRLSDGRTVYGSVLVGSDGVGSVVARHLQLPSPRYAGYCGYRGVVEIPAGAGSAPGSRSEIGPGGLPLNVIRQIWGEGARAGIYPLTPDTFYWYTCFNADEQAAAAAPASPAGRKRGALDSVRGWSWAMEEVISLTRPEDISWSRISDRWTRGTFGQGAVTLAGDAAHPMTPNLGQGACTALEDAVVLGQKLGALARSSGARPPAAADVASCLRSYESDRSARCLPLTVRANLMGAALQIPLPPVCLARNNFARTAFQPGHFLDHTEFDVGTL